MVISGRRKSTGFEVLKLISAFYLLSGGVPLLFFWVTLSYPDEGATWKHKKRKCLFISCAVRKVSLVENDGKRRILLQVSDLQIFWTQLQFQETSCRVYQKGNGKVVVSAPEGCYRFDIERESLVQKMDLNAEKYRQFHQDRFGHGIFLLEHFPPSNCKKNILPTLFHQATIFL